MAEKKKRKQPETPRDPRAYRGLLPDELAPNVHSAPQTFYEVGRNKAGTTDPGSTKVGWTLRNRKGKIVSAFAFRINPQGLTRTDGSRAKLHATKGGLFVDSFGPGPTTIQLRQVVASGKVLEGSFFTAREDVQRFMTTIYLPATASQSKLAVFFHDNHLERGMEERVFFPPQSHVLSRSVEDHNVWKLDLQMIGLDKYPYSEVRAEAVDRTGTQTGNALYRVRDGDTVMKLAVRLAGPVATAEPIGNLYTRIWELNPDIRRRRTVHGRVVKPLQLAAGELIRIPV